MAAAVLTPIDLDRHQKVRAWIDLPAVPVGTPGKVLQVTGVSWIRYRVLFENGVERGLLDGRHIIARNNYIAPEDRVPEEAVDESVAVVDGEAAGAGGEADNEFGVPAHLLERSQAARARRAAA